MAEKPLKRERRKSFNALKPALTAAFSSSHSHDRPSVDDPSPIKKTARRNSSFFGRGHGLPAEAVARRPGPADLPRPKSHYDWASDSRRKETKMVTKSRRSSAFEPLRSVQPLDEEAILVQEQARVSSGDEDEPPLSGSIKNVLGNAVVHHGEVQTTGSMWRKKNQYLVLTDTHLVRFKNQGKAAEMFPSIPASWGRSAGNRQSIVAANRQSLVSINSLQDMQMAVYNDIASGLALNSVIAVYRLDDHRQSSSLEVTYMDERLGKATSMQMQLNNAEDAELWLLGIRQAAEAARYADPVPFDQRAVEHVARLLEQERDYDPEKFRLFRVVQRASSKSPGRSSSDDLAKLSSMVCYLAIGIHKIHLIPLLKANTRASSASLSDLEASVMSFGVMTLSYLALRPGDDALALTFRVPLRGPFSVYLASSLSAEIALCIHETAEFLRPQWIQQPFAFVIPRELGDRMVRQTFVDEDYSCFDRTLIAYSAGYDIDTSNIRYMVDHECEDAPCFKLLPPATTLRQKYTALELLAVMRTLRYNESFASISFSGINLDVLQDLRDLYGPDNDAFTTRSGMPINLNGQESLCVLSQEVRALALKSKRLRRLDFSFCLTRMPGAEQGSRDPGCGILEAVFPLCRRQLTNVDWLVLNGIRLGESDLDYLVDAASQKVCHLRALEIAHCGLSAHDIDLIISTITAHESTLESINISGVQGRINPGLFQQQIGYFSRIRKINLSRISRTSGPEALIAPETLLQWRLEELVLSQTAINDQTVDSISTYLASPQSQILRKLDLNQCGLTGTDLAVILHSLSEPGKARDLHLYVSENRLHMGSSLLCEEIAKDRTPTHLTMRMVDFKKEEHFRELIAALTKNTTLKYLDISKASLPCDAGPETCKALQHMFETNNTLEELDISGEHAHLDSARIGIGLNLALTGLKKNRSIKVLRIEHQKLGLQGANTLASVLEENDCLSEVYCENNDINLQSFTVLVNGLQRNKSIIHLPVMTHDREHSLGKVKREIESVNRDHSHGTSHSTTSSIRRGVRAAVGLGSSNSSNKLMKAPPSSHLLSVPFSGSFPSSAHMAAPDPNLAGRDVETILQSLNRKWDIEVSRLQRYLARNYNAANGIEDDEGDLLNPGDTASDGRPNTAASLGTFLEKLKIDLSEMETGPLALDEEALSPIMDANPPVNSGYISGSSSAGSYRLKMDSDVSTAFQSDRPMSPLSVDEPPTPPPKDRDYFASTSSRRGSIPVSAFAPLASATSSIRSSNSNASISASTTTESTTRKVSRSTPSSTLRGFLGARAAEKESKKRGKSKEASKDRGNGNALGHATVSMLPPKLDWTLPELKL